MLRFYTAGESHGQALLAFISGLPAQLPVDVKFINHELRRRQLGDGRGGGQQGENATAGVFAGAGPGEDGGAPTASGLERRACDYSARHLAVGGGQGITAARK